MVHLIVDGHNLAYRVIYATGGADPSAAVLAFIRSLGWFVGPHGAAPVQRISVVWDGARSRRRLELYPEYKQTRRTKPETDAERRVRKTRDAIVRVLRDLLPHLGIRSILLPDHEGDDVIALVTRLIPEPIMILSSDRDFFQLLDHRVHQWVPNESDMGHGAFTAGDLEFGNDAFLLRKALVGDQSDNIRGVPKIGEKRSDTAIRDCWLKTRHRSEFLFACSRHASKPIREIPQHAAVIERNFQLMDLWLTEFREDEARALLDVLSRLMRVDVRESSKVLFHYFALPMARQVVSELAQSFGNFQRIAP